MSIKQGIINGIIEIEGGYSCNPDDSGGETMYGITEAVARDFGYAGEMCDLPRELAFSIYQGRYWDSVRGDSIEAISANVAREIVDTAINMGVHTASTILQRCLNVMNRGGGIYADIGVDGIIGSKTIDALKSLVDYRGDEVLLKALNCLQGASYIELAESREKDETFVYGWIANRV